MNKNNHNSFQKVRDNEAIAVRGELLASIDLANLAKLNLLNQPSEKLTNVVINGEYSNLLEIPLLGDPLNGLVNGILSGVVKVVGGVVGELLNTLKNLLDGVFKTLECILTGKNCPDKNKSKEKEKETVGKIITELNDLLQDNLEAITPTDNPYDDIEFKKFAVLGEALIEQHSLDSDDKRNFTFKNGLYVGKTLNIGGFINDLPLSQANYSKLFLDGDSDKDQNGGMFTAAGLNINNAEIDFNSDVYAYNTAFTPKSTIKNACIKQSDNHYFRLLTNGKLDIYRNKECSTLEGLFFSSNVNHPVTIYATEDMTIDGGIVGAVNVEGNGVVTIKYDAAYLDTLEVKEAKLVPVGRTYE